MSGKERWKECAPVELEIVSDNPRDGLCVGGRSGSAAHDPVVDGRQLVAHAVRDVCACVGGASMRCPKDPSQTVPEGLEGCPEARRSDDDG